MRLPWIFDGLVFGSLVITQRAIEIAANKEIRTMERLNFNLQLNLFDLIATNDIDAANQIIDNLNKSFEVLKDKLKTQLSVQNEAQIIIRELYQFVTQGENQLKSVTDSVVGELKAVEDLEEMELEFLDNFLPSLGLESMAQDLESQVSLSEAVMLGFRARSERELVSSRLLFKNSIAELLDQTLISRYEFVKLDERYSKYTMEKEAMLSERKRRGYIAEDSVKCIDKLGEMLRSANELSISIADSHVKRLLAQFVGICTFLVLSVLFFALTFIKKSIVSPIKEMEEATTKVAAGDYTKLTTDAYQDEIESLGQNFNSMADKIHETIEAINKINEGLELTVAQRTKEIRAILNHVSSGFFWLILTFG